MAVRKFIKNVLERAIKIYSFFVIYCSVIAPVFYPMLLFTGGPFLFLHYFYWISWFFADPTITSHTSSWLNSYLDFSFFFTDNWRYVKATIFVIGLVLFVISLARLVIGIKKNDGLVQERIYKRIRHPQNLSIIIMAFPLFLNHAFRLGDFVSWVQFIFLMIIYSDIGDMKLKKKYLFEFQSYYENTGFFFPRIFPYRVTYYFSAVYNKELRYPFLFLMYILSIYILYQLFLVLPFYWIFI